MSRSARFALAIVLPLAACAPESTPFSEVADVKQLMVSVIEPAAEVYWDAVGSIIDLEGVHEFAPQTPEEWEAVRNAAFVIAESGNLLMMGSRVRDQEAWVAMSRAMIDAGERAIAAADAQIPEAVFDMGAEIYYTCSGCHTAYAPETLRPNAFPEG